MEVLSLDLHVYSVMESHRQLGRVKVSKFSTNSQKFKNSQKSTLHLSLPSFLIHPVVTFASFTSCPSSLCLLLHCSDFVQGRSQVVVNFSRRVFISHVNILESLNPGPVYKICASKKNSDITVTREQEKNNAGRRNFHRTNTTTNPNDTKTLKSEFSLDDSEWETIWEGQPERHDQHLNVLEVEPDSVLSFSTDTIAILYVFPLS